VSALAAWLADRLTPDRDLDREQLARLSVEIGETRELWGSFARHDHDTRFYQQLYRDPNLDVWLLCWVGGQNTGYHDHDRSSGAVYVADGQLCEDYFQRAEDGWIREQTNIHTTGGHFHFDAADIHGVRHPGGTEKSTSVHVYSPALWRMGHYEPDERGMLRRVSITYADELLGPA
jgi:predicted metal-dependent enzyme (double-stranded beta helix superfamily)